MTARILFSVILCFLVTVAPAAGQDDASGAPAVSGAESQSSGGAVQAAQGDQFEILKDELLSYFIPVTGAVTEVDGDLALSDIGGKDGLRRGMRLDIHRKGKPFVHPITREPIGKTEELVGRAEVIHVCDDTSMLKVIRGEAQGGDVLRLSSATVRALFYQQSGVDWNLSEEYYFRLKDTGRFTLADTAPGAGGKEEILKEAAALNTDVAIVLSSPPSPVMTKLRQQVLWVEDGKELFAHEVQLSEGTVRKYRLGEELFTPERNQPTISFTIPYSAQMVGTGDLDGDGHMELALSTGNTVRFYSFGATLKPALDAEEIKGSVASDNIRMEMGDVDGDGRDEILLVSVQNSKVTSSLFKFDGGKFGLIWKEDLHSRIIGGTVYAQERDLRGGYRGPVFKADWQGRRAGEEAETLSLPEYFNIYDFSYITSPGGQQLLLALDRQGYLNLFDGEGSLLWRSDEDYGGAVRTIEREAPSEMVRGDTWHVSDRILARQGTAIAIKRVPVAEKARGLGFKKSRIMELYPTDSTLQEAVLVDDMPGAVLDYAIGDGKLFVLMSSMGINPANIIRGQGLFTSKLYIYSLNGN